jgi:signal transduction histidine kinase
MSDGEPRNDQPKRDPPNRPHRGLGLVAWTLAALAGSIVAAGLAYAAVSAYVTARANDNIRNVLLTHRGLHHYIQRTMHPTFYQARDEGKVAQDYYSPIIFSSSYIVRVMHGFYNEERIKDGKPPIYYKLASDNPRNPVNLATPMEQGLLKKFNENRNLREYRETVIVDGEPFLLQAIPFLETNAACLRCHGRRQDAPAGLQAMYPGEGGFNEKAGVIRAVEIIRAPLSKERHTAFLATGAFMGGLLGLAALVLFNTRLRSMVRTRTLALEAEVVGHARAENEVRELNRSLERRVEERTTQLVTANQELDAFAYSVSHDLRAPLRAIDGFSQALQEDCAAALQGEGQEHLVRIRRGCKRMGDLIEDLLKLSRYTRRELELRDLDLTRKATEIVEVLKAGSPGTHAEFVIQPGLRARGDAALIRAALENLLGNALKFSSLVAQPRIEFGSTESGGRLEFFVRDNGAGFDMAYADKLFGAFQRLHGADEFPGTGIGLATVQRILHRHGGAIRVEAAPGRGATFFFTLGGP